jgi:hypothetical protein
LAGGTPTSPPFIEFEEGPLVKEDEAIMAAFRTFVIEGN